MPFKYRLERVLELREQQLEKVKVRFQEASEHVQVVQGKIVQAKAQKSESQNVMLRRTVSEVSPSVHINRLRYLETHLLSLEEELVEAKLQLERVRAKMIDAQQKTEVLYKHKAKQKQIYNLAELKREELEMNEIGLTMKRQKDEQERINNREAGVPVEDDE